jgi:hypothetical protein
MSVLAQLHRPHRRSIGFDAVLSRKSELRLGITSRRSSIVLLVSRNAVLCVAHPGSKRALPVGSSRKTGVGSGACGQGFESPCARAATGSPAGHYDPSRSLQRKVREPGGRQTSRRSAERRASCVTGREAPRFRCFSRAASWHAHGAAIRTRASRRFAPSRGRCVGMNAKPGSQRSLDTSARPPGGAERRLFDIVNLDNRDAHMRTPIALACRP